MSKPVTPISAIEPTTPIQPRGFEATSNQNQPTPIPVLPEPFIQSTIREADKSSITRSTKAPKSGANLFFISAEQVKQITQGRNITVYQYMQELIGIAKNNARPPISHYHVGVVGLGESGALYLGVNLEFLAPLNQSVHAEQFLVTIARSLGETALKAIALSAAPCGHCRQFLYEMGNSKDLQIIIPKGHFTLDSLLPEAFGPQDLGVESKFMELPNVAYQYQEEKTELENKALEAAYNSYVPYSKAQAGVAIQTVDGKIYAGPYLENAAFNPSLSPLQTALVQLVADNQDYQSIKNVILAEKDPPIISQRYGMPDLLQSIAPQATLQQLTVD